MKNFIALLLSVVVAHSPEVVIYEDFVPEQRSFTEHGHTVWDLELSHEQKMAHRKSDEYREFMEGPIVTAIHTMMYPMVGQTEEDVEGLVVAPWSQNLLRHTVRQRFRLACWFGGLYQLMFTSSV